MVSRLRLAGVAGSLLLLLSSALTFAARPQVTATAAPAPLLPASFAGWQLNGSIERSTDARVADPTNVPVLGEYGFRDYATANYAESGNTVTLRAMRFADATGAYGAYTFYRIPGMHPEDIGRGAAANGSRVLFWTAATLVDAKFDHLTAMSAAELRELAQKLPVPAGVENIPPSLPGYLPRKNLEITYTRYALGPEAYTRMGGVLPAQIIDFSRSPEVMTGAYSTTAGDGTLTLIEYPTPQIATEREGAIANYLKSKGQAPAGGSAAGAPTQGSQQWTQALAESAPAALQTRRSGLLVAVSSGAFAAADARRLLEGINYEAAVTWNHPQGYVPETTKAAELLLGIFALTVVLGGTAILLGVFLGGGRVLLRKLRGKPLTTVEEAEFIRLDLK